MRSDEEQNVIIDCVIGVETNCFMEKSTICNWKIKYYSVLYYKLVMNDDVGCDGGTVCH